MQLPANIDLFFVGIAIATTLIFGFVVFFYNRYSATNRAFLWLSLATIAWSVSNYLTYQFSNPVLILWLLRFAIFFAVWYAFAVFYLFYIFPDEEAHLPPIFRTLLVPLMGATSLLTLTPYVFERIGSFTTTGRVGTVMNGPGMIAFGPVVTTLVFGGLYVLFQKTRHAVGRERTQYRLMLIGAMLTYTFIILFNFLLPAFLNISTFVRLGAVFTLPFIMLTAYAIIRHGLFNVKVVSTEILTFALSLVLLLEVVFSTNAITIAYRMIVFLTVLGAGILLIRSVRKEVTQREQVTHLAESLEKANIRLQELDRQKTEFLSIASHQLRTPLSIIKGYLELIKDGAYGKPSQKLLQTLDDMDQSNERLVVLVDEFLDVSRIEQGRTKFSFQPHDMNELVTSVVKELTERAADKNIAIEWHPAPALKSIVMDDEKIRHVVFNFIDNAIKYSDRGTVRVTATYEDGGVAVRVLDEGLGFNKEDEVNFFQKFYRGKNVEGVNVNGTGLGIYVCRQFIESHSGRVWAHSPGLGQGSEFGFWIPLRQKVAQAPDAGAQTLAKPRP